MGVPVVAAYCAGNEVHAAFHHSMTNLLIHEALSGESHILEPGGGAFGSIGTARVATARNGLVRTFLEASKAEWLWMLDTDMVFKSDTLERLLAVADDEHPVVGGLCFAKDLTNNVFPTLYYVTQQGKQISRLEDYPKDQLLKVDGTGAACLLMHRSALEAVRGIYEAPREWFSDQVWNGTDMGEDLTFCLRLKEAGIPVFVHTGIRIGHIKPTIVDESYYEEVR